MQEQSNMADIESNTVEEPKQAVERPFYRTIVEVGIWILLFFLVRATGVEAYKIPTGSMESTLLVGDFILVNKMAYGGRLPFTDIRLPGWRTPEAGDVVVFLFPVDEQTRYIKRCVAVGGDTVEVKDKVLFVNGKEVSYSQYAQFVDTLRSGAQVIKPRRSIDEQSRDNWGPVVIPDGQYFMMGDNRDNSYDSRWWGPVEDRLIIGQAFLIHWSWDDTHSPTPDMSLTDPLSLPRAAIHDVVHFPSKVRWSRLGTIIE